MQFSVPSVRPSECAGDNTAMRLPLTHLHIRGCDAYRDVHLFIFPLDRSIISLALISRPMPRIYPTSRLVIHPGLSPPKKYHSYFTPRREIALDRPRYHYYDTAVKSSRWKKGSPEIQRVMRSTYRQTDCR